MDPKHPVDPFSGLRIGSDYATRWSRRTLERLLLRAACSATRATPQLVAQYDRDWDKHSKAKQTCECLQLNSGDGRNRAWLDVPVEEAMVEVSHLSSGTDFHHGCPASGGNSRPASITEPLTCSNEKHNLDNLRDLEVRFRGEGLQG